MDQQGLNQHERRNSIRARDQHGREWFFSVELKSGMPCGIMELCPGEGFIMPPLRPPPKFIRYDRARPYDVAIDYDAWLLELRQAHAQYNRDALEEGMRQFGEKYDPEASIARSVVAVIGQPPQAIEPVLAAKQGNPWIVGKDARPDRRLEKFFVRVKPTFEPDYSKLDFGELDAGGEEEKPHQGESPASFAERMAAARAAKRAAENAAAGGAGLAPAQ